MQQFQDGHHVRLRSRERGMYLHVDEDGHGVSLHHRRASMNAAWVVHLYHGHAEYVLLHSAAYGRYLAATDAPAPLGHRGLRVELRDYAQPEVQAIMWKADGVDSGNDVLLWQFTGRCLRANGRYLSWNNGVSAEDIEDTYIVSTMLHWVVEPIPARESMPPLPRQTGFPFPRILDALLPSRLIVYVRAGADGTRISHGALVFRGRSVVRLRNKLVRRLDVSDLVMCVEAGTFGRLTPLVVDLPRSVRHLHTVVFASGTPAHAEVRYPDVDAV
ncbi:uncharacterized protein LOC119338505 [Triticum dicoccoides]|uniref:uncharacterized protein LOC119338505 n=1 Tax=Triticum dicoccoides TaxID=85692 RepID=UPI00162D3F88|nr:uncharacterized protein LOC119338505 [Triticum dicoccoides]